MSITSRTWLASLIAIFTACEPQPPATENAPAPTTAAAPASASFLRATVLPRDSQFVLVPCGTTDTLTVHDETRQIARSRQSFGEPAQPATFALLLGQRNGANYAVNQVLFAAANTSDCFREWGNVDVRAQGNEPGWVIEITGSVIKLQRQGGATNVWTNATRSDEGFRFAAHSAEADPIELRLERRDCNDGMSGDYYRWTALTRFAGTHLDGCGVKLR